MSAAYSYRKKDVKEHKRPLKAGIYFGHFQSSPSSTECVADKEEALTYTAPKQETIRGLDFRGCFQ